MSLWIGVIELEDSGRLEVFRRRRSGDGDRVAAAGARRAALAAGHDFRSTLEEQLAGFPDSRFVAGDQSRAIIRITVTIADRGDVDRNRHLVAFRRGGEEEEGVEDVAQP